MRLHGATRHPRAALRSAQRARLPPREGSQHARDVSCLAVTIAAIGAGLLVSAGLFAGTATASSRRRPRAPRRAAARSASTSRNDCDYIDPALAYFRTRWQVAVRDAAEAARLPGRGRRRRQPHRSARPPQASRSSRATGRRTRSRSRRASASANGEAGDGGELRASPSARALNPKMQSPASSFLTTSSGQGRPRRQGAAGVGRHVRGNRIQSG